MWGLKSFDNLRKEPRGIKRKERRIGFFDNLYKEIYIYIYIYIYRGMTDNLEGGGNNLWGLLVFIPLTVQPQERKERRQC